MISVLRLIQFSSTFAMSDFSKGHGPCDNGHEASRLCIDKGLIYSLVLLSDTNRIMTDQEIRYQDLEKLLEKDNKVKLGGKCIHCLKPRQQLCSLVSLHSTQVWMLMASYEANMYPRRSSYQRPSLAPTLDSVP